MFYFQGAVIITYWHASCMQSWDMHSVKEGWSENSERIFTNQPKVADFSTTYGHL